MKRRVIKGVLQLIRCLIEVLCGTGMIAITAWIVHNGGNMTWPKLLMIWFPLAIPLVICMAIDWREEKKAEQARFLATLRRHEREKQRYPERYR